MKIILLIGLLLVLIAFYALLAQPSSLIESQISPEEIDSTLIDAGSMLLEENDDIVIGELI